jgi:hypothetical protein
MTMTAGSNNRLENISATSAPFSLVGGLYSIAVTGSDFGTVSLERLGPNGNSWLKAIVDFTANGISTAYLAPGSYRVAIASATGVYADITRIVQ